MKRVSACFIVLLLLAPRYALSQSADSTRAHDTVFGVDKPKHFLLSFFIQSSSFATIQATGADRRAAMDGALAITSLFGLGREIHDRRTKGLFSFADLAWDAIGAGTAVVMLRHTYR